MILHENPVVLTETLIQACRDWYLGSCYMDVSGDYRWFASSAHRRANITPWNKEVKRNFATIREFTEYSNKLAVELNFSLKD